MSTVRAERVRADQQPAEKSRATPLRMVDGSPPPTLPTRALKGLVLVIICAMVIVPFIGIVSTSIADDDALTRSGGFVLFPTSFSLDAYRAIFAGGVVVRALTISAFVTVVGTASSLLVTSLLGWALSRRGTVGNRLMLVIVLLSLLFTPGMIPTYLVVAQFGLINSLWSLILPTMVSGFNVVVIRSFFVGIPQEIIDSALIDGAGEWAVFRHIALPLSRAVLAVIGLFYAVSYWNAFFGALLYINDASKWPVQLVLRTYVVNGNQIGPVDLGQAAEVAPPQTSLQMAILVVSILPILILYPFLQKHFEKGVLTGAVKG